MSSPTTALAIAEGRRFVRNPFIWVSLLPTALWLRVAVRDSNGEDRLFLLVGYGLGISGFVMVAAVVLATLRGRMERTDELLDTLAVGPDRRSLGHLGSTLALGAIGVVVTIAIGAVLRPAESLGTWDPSDTGVAVDIPRPNLAQLLQGPLALVAVATLAIAVVRWVPTWLVLAPLLFALMVQMLFIGVYHGVPADDGRWLFPLGSGIVNGSWSGCREGEPGCALAVSGYDRVAPWWHAGYLVAAACWFGSVAVLRHRRDRRSWAWFVVSLAALIGVGLVQVLSATEFVAS